MNESLWMATSQGIRFERIQESMDVPILVIGGGMTGIQTAYLLVKQGLEVVLVDADKIGYGTSARNTGKLTPQCHLVYGKIKKQYGLEYARDFYKANQNALAEIKTILSREHIDCDFEKMPSYIFSEQLDQMSHFEEEYKVYQELGIKGELTDTLELPLGIKVALSQEHAGAFNPKKYMDGLIKVLKQLGVKMYEHSPVTQIYKGNKGWEVTVCDQIPIVAQHVVCCSHYPLYDNYSFYMTRLYPEASYLIAGAKPKNFPKASFLSIDNPTRSFRPCMLEGQEWLLIGGENHKVGIDLIDHYEVLRTYGRQKFEMNTYEYEWCAQCYKTPDEIPYIGYLNEHSDQIYVATGFNKWGNLNSMIAAKRLVDLIIGKKEEDTGVYDPSRLKGYFTGTYLKNNSQIAWEWIKSKVELTPDELPKQKDQAKIVQIDGKRYGAYKDKQGEMHIVDITCPHMGAELNWNDVDKSWDCPCHGSRFTVDGEVIEGPATYYLKHYGEGENRIDPKM